MAVQKEAIIDVIEKFIMAKGGEYGKWFVGATKDVSHRIFSVHGVDKAGGDYIFRPADTIRSVNEIIEYFMDKGCMGEPVKTGDDSLTVYIYRTTGFTIEEIRR